MLLIEARVGTRQIHGLGLFARQFIPRGTCVWRFHADLDRKITQEQLEDLSPAARAQVLWYAYRDDNEGVYVLSGDDDRFTNHSSSPNTANDGDMTFAVRDILPDEEITWNYEEYGGIDFEVKSYSHNHIATGLDGMTE